MSAKKPKSTAKKKKMTVVTTHPNLTTAGADGALTQRELQLLKEMAEGRSTRSLSELLHLTENTIETHRKNILKKLKASNMIEAVTIAFRKNILK